MNVTRLLCASALFSLVGCGAQTVGSTSQGSTGAAIEGIASCSGVPSTFGNPAFASYKSDTGTLYLPTNATPSTPLWVVFASDVASYYGTQTASLHYSTDNWATTKDVAMTKWCDANDTYGSTAPLFGLSLGTLAAGTTVVIDVHQLNGGGYYQPDVWVNNGGQNYQFSIGAAEGLSWVGSSQLGFGGLALDASQVPVGQALTISAQTYPAGAAVAATVNWVDAKGNAGSTPLAFGTGASANNDLWTGTLPASLDAGAFTYYIAATDGTGATVRDVAAGSEHQVSPAAYPVSWAGNLGCFLPYGGDPTYTIGCDFAADESTTTGCDNGGADLDSYSARAVQVYIPGVTDRSFASPEAAAAFSQMILAQVYTNAETSGSWGTIGAEFGEQSGNNFVYTFFNYTDLCHTNNQGGIPDGTYQYKLRFSTDGGATFYWLGSSAGGTGGNDLVVNYSFNGMY